MIDLEARLGTVGAAYLTNRLARLPCPPGTIPRDLPLDGKTREAFRRWLDAVKARTVIGGSGQGLCIKGPIPLRNTTAAAMATASLLAAPHVYGELPPTAVPIRALSTTGYLDAVKASYDDDDDESGDLVRACKAGLPRDVDRLNVRLLLLLNLGAEPRRKTSDFPREELRALLSLRLERGMPTIITTRLASGDLTTDYGEEFIALLVANSEVVQVTEAS